MLIIIKNYPTDVAIDSLFRVLLNIDFEIVYNDKFYIKILTKTGFFVKFWTANKYYAWLRCGSIIEEKTGKVIYDWDKLMPSRRTICKFKKLLDKKAQSFIKTILTEEKK